MRLQRYKRPRYLWPSYLSSAAHSADALPRPSLASHLRQGMAARGRALTDRLTPLQHAFWPSFCRNGNGLPRRAHHGHNYKCPPSHLSHLASVLCSIIRPNIIETIQLFLPHSSQTSVQYTNTTLQPTNHPTTTSNHHTHTKHYRLSTVCPARPHQCQQPRQPQGSLNTHQRLNSSKPHIRNGRRQHNVLSGAAPFAAASLPRPTTKPPSACSSQAELNGFASMLLDN